MTDTAAAIPADLIFRPPVAVLARRDQTLARKGRLAVTRQDDGAGTDSDKRADGWRGVRRGHGRFGRIEGQGGG